MGDLYDTAFSPTTQSKLTVQAPGFGERGSSFGDSILFGIAASAIFYPTPVRIHRGITASAILSTGDYRTGDYRAKSAIRWPAKTLSLHVLALLADTVFARISLLAGWLSVPEARENTVFTRITLLTDTVFARIDLLAGRRKGTLCTAPYLGSVA
ncbi:hypothetical protein [Desulfosporosinus sp. OT]|uniref:hypothetical protein n=1 Tax=Desulfosporosinus sp. OT TaxID=913865 RepID=UPI000223A631|nr:hypothetical protein [Desulfosporosinus sp. OT]EGW37890.1 hypothetical protein DOT_4298 [Desulfosporosinus sp. OT]